ncbi:MAG: hypothetical protein ACI9E5_001059 [Candidatus Omnitrophota bacterium]|jgi:hypothetical protein
MAKTADSKPQKERPRNNGGQKKSAARKTPDKILNDESHFNITKLKNMNMADLIKVGRDLDVPGVSGCRKQDLIFKVLQAQAESAGVMFGEGTLEILYVVYIITIYHVLMIFIFHHHKFVDLI